MMIKTTVNINGMACGMCEAHVNDCIRREFSVKKVNSSHKKGVCEIISEMPLDEQKLRRAITDTGYEGVSVASEPYVKKGLFSR